jgi:DNA-binding XRE family transcriptional regulator
VTKDEFKELRAKAGHTQAALAKEMGVHPRTVTRWEIGEIIIPRVVELAIRYIAEHANKGGLTTRSTTRSLLEDKIDVGAAKAALLEAKKKGTVAWKKMELGLSEKRARKHSVSRRKD